MPGDGGGADIECHSEDGVAEPGEQRHHLLLLPNRHRHRPTPGTERGLEHREDGRVHRQAGESPLLLQGLEQPLQIAGRAGQIRLLHRDVVKSDDRVDRE